jgi:hypothetical protein
MNANDFATAGFIDSWMRAILTRLEPPAPAAAGPAADVVLYSVQKLALVLDVHVETVRLWLNKGKKGRSGQPIKLQAFRFTSEPRIPWPARRIPLKAQASWALSGRDEYTVTWLMTRGGDYARFPDTARRPRGRAGTAPRLPAPGGAPGAPCAG